VGVLDPAVYHRVFAVPGTGQLVSLVLAALAGWYAFRIWTGRAKYLTIFLIF
jgi:hypothetical protein